MFPKTEARPSTYPVFSSAAAFSTLNLTPRNSFLPVTALLFSLYFGIGMGLLSFAQERHRAAAANDVFGRPRGIAGRIELLAGDVELLVDADDCLVRRQAVRRPGLGIVGEDPLLTEVRKIGVLRALECRPGRGGMHFRNRDRL